MLMTSCPLVTAYVRITGEGNDFSFCSPGEGVHLAFGPRFFSQRGTPGLWFQALSWGGGEGAPRPVTGPVQNPVPGPAGGRGEGEGVNLVRPDSERSTPVRY